MKAPAPPAHEFEAPLSGEPPTVMTVTPEGKLEFTLTVLALGPEQVKSVEQWTGFLQFVFFLACFLMFIASANIVVGLILLCVYGWGSNVIEEWIDSAMRVETRIVMTTAAISVTSAGQSRHFDWNTEHSFSLVQHDRTKEEHLKNDLEERKASANGRVIQKKAYFGESFHVVLSHAGHRRDIAEVYGHKEAAEIVARLVYCDRCLNEAAHMGGGIYQRPEDDWNQAPGGLRDA